VKRWRRRHGHDIWNTAGSRDEVTPDLDLEFREFIDDEQIDLLSGEPTSCGETAWPRKPK
jgi:hypothetical protein